MFEVGFSELLVIAVVALLVLGPERLPKAARFAGLWVRRARAQWNSVKDEFERDIADDELKRALRETQASLRDAQASLRDAGSHMQREFHGARNDLMRGPQPQPALSSPTAVSAVTPTASTPTSAAPPTAEELLAFERSHNPKLHEPPDDDDDVER